MKLKVKKQSEAVSLLELEQLKADLKRLVSKTHTNCARLREALDFENFAEWIAIECHIRCYLNQLNQPKGN